jgi:CubicO group peptidase (beta-lactamase class C family)
MTERSRAHAGHHLPVAGDFLLWPPTIQPWGYRIVDRLFAHRVIKRGEKPALWKRGPEIAVGDVDAFMERNFIAGVLVVKDGQIRLERYGLGLRQEDRWSTMSTIKSMTAVLVGAALHDGSIGSLDAAVTGFLPGLAGSAYEGVSLRHLLTMSSGVAWTEVYSDPDSDVNRYSRSLAARDPGGVLRLMAALPRARAPGSGFLYNSGDTYLLGAALRAAVGRPLAEYMAERVWQPAGMEFDGFYTLDSEGGQEIGGSRAGVALRDFGRFAQFVLDDGVIRGRRVLPEGFVAEAATAQFTLEEARPTGLTGYGYSWWLGDGVMSALGFAGQRIDLFRAERLAVITLAAFPQAPHVAAERDSMHREDVAAFTRVVRAAV